MGKLAVQKYFSFLILIATFILTGFTFFGLFGGSVNPAGNTARAMLVYALPIIIVGDVIMLAYWLLRRRWKWVPIPLVTLLCCIPYSGTIYQLRSHISGKDFKGGLSIATYNVAMFNRETTGFIALDVLANMKRQGVDVLCIQEYNDISGDKKNSDSYKDYFPHMAQGRNDMVIYSRYPIAASKNIDFGETNNSAMWADIDFKGNTIRVYNIHLETTGISRTFHQAAKQQLLGLDIDNSRLLRAIYGNYTLGMIARAGQANILANDIRQSPNPAIVCGDFNDVPYSYVYNTMLGNLVDGFKECGSGFMYTFRGSKKVRIDYIFHDEALHGVTYYKQELSYSDHYPVFMKLEVQ